MSQERNIGFENQIHGQGEAPCEYVYRSQKDAGQHARVLRDNGYFETVIKRERYAHEKEKRKLICAFMAVICILLIAVVIMGFVIGVMANDGGFSASRDGGRTGAGDGADTANTGGINASAEGGSQKASGEPTDSASPIVFDKITVCIDPGHGFDDIGAEPPMSSKVYEKDINSAVAEKLKVYLEQKGYAVVMTHNGDEGIEKLKPNADGKRLMNPAARCDFAAKYKIDAYISLHCDTYEDREVGGTRIYYCENTGYKSDKLADCVSKALGAVNTKKTPSVIGYNADKAYKVTKDVQAPSILVEMGFLTNRADLEFLTDGKNQESFAALAAEGIDSFLKG